MRTKIASTLLLAIALMVSSSFSFAQKTETRKVKDFESISLSIAAKVYLTQEENTSVKIKARAEDLDEIVTEIDGETLKIKRKKTSRWGWNQRSLKHVEVYISTPNVRDLNVSGSGTILASSPILSRNVDYAISGSGKIIVEKLKAENVECHISGSGDVRLKGICENELEIHISGSGDVDAAYLEAKNVEVRVAGSGDSRVFASDRITARVAGSGDIYYRGNPQHVDSKSAGSGTIRSIGE